MTSLSSPVHKLYKDVSRTSSNVSNTSSEGRHRYQKHRTPRSQTTQEEDQPHDLPRQRHHSHHRKPSKRSASDYGIDSPLFIINKVPESPTLKRCVSNTGELAQPERPVLTRATVSVGSGLYMQVPHIPFADEECSDIDVPEEDTVFLPIEQRTNDGADGSLSGGIVVELGGEKVNSPKLVPQYQMVRRNTILRPPKPKDYMLLACMVMCCCNPCIGALALLFSVKSTAAYEVEKYGKATKLARGAFFASLAGVAITVIIVVSLLVTHWPKHE